VQTIPSWIGSELSFVVTEHERKLALDGGFVIQFLDVGTIDCDASDAPVQGRGEPSVFWSSRQLVELSRAAGLKLSRYARILPVMSRYGIRCTSSRKLASKWSFLTGTGRQIEDLRRGEDFKLSLLLVPIMTVPNSGIRAAPAHFDRKQK
jgi:hypothetical protein